MCPQWFSSACPCILQGILPLSHIKTSHLEGVPWGEACHGEFRPENSAKPIGEEKYFIPILLYPNYQPDVRAKQRLSGTCKDGEHLLLMYHFLKEKIILDYFLAKQKLQEIIIYCQFPVIAGKITQKTTKTLDKTFFKKSFYLKKKE